MSISQSVSSHLPFLRRYARALTGSQVSGDKYVEAALNTLVNQPELITDKTSVRVEMFRIFSKIWNSLAVNGQSDPSTPIRRTGISARSAPCPGRRFCWCRWKVSRRRRRHAFWALALSELRELIDECGRELASQIATNIMIIEDEALIAMDLQSLVENLGHDVQGVARTARRP